MLGRLVSWFKRNDCTCDPYYGILGSPCPSHPVWQPHDLRDRMQRKCVEWGVYWRAPDAHGIQVNVEQATELLADAVGVEVEITCPQDALAHGQPVVDAVLLADLKRCMDDVATEMRARGRSDSRFVQLSARIAALTGATP